MTVITEKRRRLLNQYGGATLAVLAASLLTIVVLPFNDGAMYFLFLTAIFFGSLYGGLKPGLLAVTLSLLAVFLIIVCLEKTWFKSLADVAVLLLFCVMASLIVMLCHLHLRVEEARKRAESKYRIIFENAITGIYETTINGQFAAANPKLAEMLGYDAPAQMIEEKADLNSSFYLKPERRREFAHLIQENGVVAGFESEIYRRDGTPIWITENALAVRDENHNLIGFQGTTIEITARKLAEAALEKARQELEQKIVERTGELEQTNKILRAEIAERGRIETEIRRSRQQLRELTAHLQSVREHERTHIAREIHDELGQMLTALNIDLSWLEERLAKTKSVPQKNELLEKIGTMLQLVNQTINTVQKIAAELRPGILDELGLEAAFEWQVQDFQKRTRVNCELITDFDETNLSRDLMTAMFRILQECLTNIARHAAAQRAKFVLRDEDNDLLLEVTDDGRGIRDEEISNPRSLGLLGIRERALMLGGAMEIQRLAPNGTTVKIRIPRQLPEKREVTRE